MDNASSSKPVILGLGLIRFRLDICLSLLRSITYWHRYKLGIDQIQGLFTSLLGIKG
ncbi:hypothetical protein RHEph02_gp002 [Rhizobium phage RHEph02]|uniref:Uncharacterized protein n=1 Tax=Rhizobium phage RHEph02 TaxID=1220602 RepID=L7TMP3_9CAUD|nr:hypothetical protein HOS21_gp02 [Rhizobium phage RHEph02]AGC35569.1 hypothetical protein RHEph02_gp002 [Rhizobium phage RHEph02]